MNIIRYRKVLSTLWLLMTIGSCSEPTELPVLQQIHGTKTKKRKDISFLDKIPEDRRDDVLSLIEDDNQSLEEKCDKLYNIVDPESTVMEEIVTYLNKNPCSPFLFLIGIEPHTVNSVHELLLSQQPDEHKNKIIHLILEGKKLHEKMYWKWKMNLFRDIPRDILDLLPLDVERQVISLFSEKDYSKAVQLSSAVCSEAGQALQEWVDKGTSTELHVWHKFVFDNAQKILGKWINTRSNNQNIENDVLAEEKTSSADAVEASDSEDIEEKHDAALHEFEVVSANDSQENMLNKTDTDVCVGLSSFSSENSEDESEQDSDRESPQFSKCLFDERSPLENTDFSCETAVYEVHSNAHQPSASSPLSSYSLQEDIVGEPTTSDTTSETGEKCQSPDLSGKSSCGDDTASINSSNYEDQAPKSPLDSALNIVFFGPTGVGKTTFINGFGNYLLFKNLDEALQGNTEIRADASFTVTEDKTYKCLPVKITANTGQNLEEMRGNERLNNDGQSSTQKPMEHLFEWNDDGEKKIVRIIDTPGIFDTRGQSQDRLNTGKIFEYVHQFGEIHAICILLKPNEAKFTLEFRQSLDQLFRELNQSAIKNILFCFTNCRTTQYRPGESLVTLRKYLKKLWKESGIEIEADGNNIFCFDNDCFRYLCAAKQIPGMHSTELDMIFGDGWRINVKETKRLLQKVATLTVHSVEDSVAVHRARMLLPELSRLLGEHSVNQFKLLKQIENDIEELKIFEGAAETWESKLIYEEVKWETVPLEKPRTICKSPECVVYESISDSEVQAIPIKACCEDCDVPPEDIQKDPSGIGRCKAFTEPGICGVCECSWERHIQITTELKRIKQEKPDFNALKHWKTCEKAKIAKEDILKELEQKKDELRLENEKMREFVAECAVFLSSNAIKKGKDAYVHYLEYLIQKEEGKHECGGGDMELAFDLAGILDAHSEQVKDILAEIKKGQRNTFSPAELKERLDELEKLKISGSAIAQIASYLHM